MNISLPVPTTSSVEHAEDNDDVLIGNIIGGIIGCGVAVLALVIICIACKIKNKSKGSKKTFTETKQKGNFIIIKHLKLCVCKLRIKFTDDIMTYKKKRHYTVLNYYLGFFCLYC